MSFQYCCSNLLFQLYFLYSVPQWGIPPSRMFWSTPKYVGFGVLFGLPHSGAKSSDSCIDGGSKLLSLVHTTRNNPQRNTKPHLKMILKAKKW